MLCVIFWIEINRPLATFDWKWRRMAMRTTFLFHSGDFGRPFLLVWEKEGAGRRPPILRGASIRRMTALFVIQATTPSACSRYRLGAFLLGGRA